MQAKEKVYQALKKYAADGKGITAAELAGKLNLSRQVVSHYLTRLLEDGAASKTATRPVLWFPMAEDELDFFAGAGGTVGAGAGGIAGASRTAGASGDVGTSKDAGQSGCSGGEASGYPASLAKTAQAQENHPSVGVFASMVGCGGSQRQNVEMCMAAVNYPPDGLPILLTGESGVGKSFIARLIYEYAVSREVIRKDAPFVVLNCADYANNPELLSATLLGYKKGSFTGAGRDKDGLLKEADGGYLFLDEVHRLSFENQEKLFLFMDSGRYRPLGDSGWKTSRVRFIFATTENPGEVLLETFRRRITLRIPIPNMMERPLKERIQMLYLFYRKEAKKIGRPIEVEAPVVTALCFTRLEGNIGKLENLVQVGCANAFYRQADRPRLSITMRELPPENWIRPEQISLSLPALQVHGQAAPWEETVSDAGGLGAETRELWEDIIKIPAMRMEASADSVYLNFRRFMKKLLSGGGIAGSGRQWNLFGAVCGDMLSSYGVRETKNLTAEMGLLYELFKDSALEEELSKGLVGFFEQVMPKAYYVAGRLHDRLREMDDAKGNELVFLFALSLHEYIVESMEFCGLIVAHGDSTASSIKRVANRTCRTFVFEAIDMPMDTAIDDTIQKVHQFLEQVNTRKGMILLVDTGSLSQMYSSIKNDLAGDLLIVNNVTTAIALDIGIKMLGRCSFLDIVKGARDSYTFEIQYFEGVARGRNLIVSCMSGVGIAEKLQEVMGRVIDPSLVDVVTLDYQELRRLLDENQKEYFSQTLLILTTSALPEYVKVPWLNIYDILDGKGESLLWNALKGLITRETFEELKREYIRFFSIEGIVSRLRFLNPAVVIHEVELILMRYEQYYRLEMTGHIRLNLYMHIAFMIERLMTADPAPAYETGEPAGQEKRFYEVSGEILGEIEKKYRIQVNPYELSLLYELFRRIIIEEKK